MWKNLDPHSQAVKPGCLGESSTPPEGRVHGSMAHAGTAISALSPVPIAITGNPHTGPLEHVQVSLDGSHATVWRCLRQRGLTSSVTRTASQVPPKGSTRTRLTPDIMSAGRSVRGTLLSSQGARFAPFLRASCCGAGCHRP